MNPFVIGEEKDLSEDPDKKPNIKEIIQWMVLESNGIHSRERHIAFLKKVIKYLATVAPISTWGTDELGRFVKEHEYRFLEQPLRIGEGNPPCRLSRPILTESFWKMRVVQLEVVRPRENIFGIWFNSDFTEVRGQQVPQKTLEKRLFIHPEGEIIGVDLFSNVSQGNKCNPHRIDVGIADDAYLLEIFEKDVIFFDIIWSRLKTILDSAMDKSLDRLVAHRNAVNDMKVVQGFLSQLS